VKPHGQKHTAVDLRVGPHIGFFKLGAVTIFETAGVYVIFKNGIGGTLLDVLNNIHSNFN
jgi:hypothetical protein